MGPLCHPMLSWIYVDTIIPGQSVIDKEGADTVGVHSFQTITFQMMIATFHFFNGIAERSHVHTSGDLNIGGTLGLCGEQPFSHTLMGYGNGSR